MSTKTDSKTPVRFIYEGEPVEGIVVHREGMNLLIRITKASSLAKIRPGQTTIVHISRAKYVNVE